VNEFHEKTKRENENVVLVLFLFLGSWRPLHREEERTLPGSENSTNADRFGYCSSNVKGSRSLLVPTPKGT
jgi:hypothetical protein